LSLFPWASFRSSKGGIKLHLLLSHDDYLPEFVHITHARHSDLGAVRHLPPLRAGSIVVLDRGYIDFDLLASWNKAGVFFVIRSKKNIEFVVKEKRPLQPGRVLSDEMVVRLTEMASSAKPSLPLRRVTAWDE